MNNTLRGCSILTWTLFHQLSLKRDMPGIIDQGKTFLLGHSIGHILSSTSVRHHTDHEPRGSQLSVLYSHNPTSPPPPFPYPFCSTSIHPCSSGSSRHLSIILSSSLVGRVSSSPYQRHSPHSHGSAQHCQSSRTRRNQQSVHTRTLVRQPVVGQRSYGPQHKYT